MARSSEGAHTFWIATDRRARAALEMSLDIPNLTPAVQFAVDPLLKLLPKSGRMFLVLSSAVQSSAVTVRYPHLGALLWRLAEATEDNDPCNNVVLLCGSSRRQCARHLSEDPALRTAAGRPFRILTWSAGRESAASWSTGLPAAFRQHWRACRGAAFSFRIALVPECPEAAEFDAGARLTGVHRRHRRLRPGPEAAPRPRLLDAFAGSGALEAAAREAGWEVDRVELTDGPEIDLTKPEVLNEYCNRLESGHYRWLHTGPPCKTFRKLWLNGPGWRQWVTRTQAVPQGDGTSEAESSGNRCAHAAARLLEVAHRAGVV